MTSTAPARHLVILALAFGSGTGEEASARSAPERTEPTQVATLLASDGQQLDHFGSDVAVDGDTVLVGAELEDERGSDAGATYVFRRDEASGAWLETAKLLAPDARPDDLFGSEIALSGDTAVIAATGRGDTLPAEGVVFVFQRFGQPGFWVPVQTLVAPDVADDRVFGSAVALDGDTLVVGALFDDELGPLAGAAYVFERSIDGRFHDVAKLTASDGAGDSYFGTAVDVLGDLVLVGARRDDSVALNAGSAYVFGRDVGGPDAWGQAVKLVPEDGGSGDGFGTAVTIGWRTLAVGVPDSGSAGAVYVFAPDPNVQGGWVLEEKLEAGDEDARRFGSSLELSGGRLVVGDPGNDQAGSQAGAAYLFQRTFGDGDDEIWEEVAKLVPEELAAQDQLDRVGFDGRWIVLGAQLSDLVAASAGAAWVYEQADLGLALEGDCPGEVTIEVEGATPGGVVALFVGPEPGSTPVDFPPCPRLEVDLFPARRAALLSADGGGGAALGIVMPAPACDVLFQAFDAITCERSPVASPPAGPDVR